MSTTTLRPPTTTFLASPNNVAQAIACFDQDVLLSFGLLGKRTFAENYEKAWGRILIDSGAYSELSSGKSIDLDEYAEFANRWSSRAVAIAGLDDISGDYRRSLRNYEVVGFPTYHDTDPPEILKDLIHISRERGGWLGVGIKPPRHNKGEWLAKTLASIPDDIHVHGWALRLYRNTHTRFDSFDSTNWWRDSFKLKALPPLKHLTDKELLDIVVKRYEREERMVRSVNREGEQQRCLGI